MKKKYICLFLLIIWMSVIFYLSNQKAAESSELSNGLLDIILDFLRIQVDSTTRTFLEKFIRKCAHFGEYFILGVLSVNAFKGFRFKRVYLCSMILCSLYAISDEIHQLLVLDRYGSLIDVLLDVFASFLAFFFTHQIEKCFQEKKR